MLNIFTKLLDLIATPQHSVLLLREETIETFLRHYNKTKHGDVISLSNFNSPQVHAAITANKFYDHPKAAVLLAALLSTWLDSLPKKSTIVVPIPLGPKRQKDRGYNQVTRILTYLHKTDIAIEKLLIRPRNTEPQTNLGRAARLKNLEGAFSTRQPLPNLAGVRIIICDDVVTTGATLKAARAALRPYLSEDVELLCVALAH